MKKHFLNIGDTAGVASILYKYLKTLYSIESEVITYSHLDPLGYYKILRRKACSTLSHYKCKACNESTSLSCCASACSR
jgi:hypothetical protein